ncbi:MAG: carbon-nitrogen hydrolase family protein [Solirubrobacteraceae bacterium]
MTDQSIQACAVQMNSTADRAANFAQADRLTRSAVAAGAQLVVLPEKWNLLADGLQLAAGAEPLDGPAISWARAVARELSIDLIAGSIVLAPANTNTCVHVGPDGEIRARYSKLHMFDVAVEGTVYRESVHTRAGEEVVASDVRGARTALSICYDLRFPELYRKLAAELIVVPSAFTRATTRDHWEILLRARAIENQAWVVAANQTGEHGSPGLHSGGRSMIVDPWGVVVARAGEDVGLTCANLDMQRLERIRAELPALDARRLSVGAIAS